MAACVNLAVESFRKARKSLKTDLPTTGSSVPPILLVTLRATLPKVLLPVINTSIKMSQIPTAAKAEEKPRQTLLG
jgi:hypothetical protein